jgi:hypothetical protein
MEGNDEPGTIPPQWSVLALVSYTSLPDVRWRMKRGFQVTLMVACGLVASCGTEATSGIDPTPTTDAPGFICVEFSDEVGLELIGEVQRSIVKSSGLPPGVSGFRISAGPSFLAFTLDQSVPADDVAEAIRKLARSVATPVIVSLSGSDTCAVDGQ